ncbi:MAG: formylglycine-generating enzyme family protein [Bernardetiaceae bacterium]|nr:formylglycine-generating enzyme family protein [Bernardetiaceae bacterium]
MKRIMENDFIETINGVSFKMIYVASGAFMMGCTPEQGSHGSSWEQPVHKVSVSDFYIGETVVTQKLWRAIMGSDPENLYNSGCDDCPVEGINWYTCKAFIERLNHLRDREFRLPTEAEWEYAARGGMKSKGYQYAGSNDIDAVAWYDENAYEVAGDSPDYGIHPVAQK